MVKLLYLFYLYVCFLPLYGQLPQKSESVDVIFEVRSGVDNNQVVRGAIVDLKGFGDKLTDSLGKAIFKNVTVGVYRYSIYHENYQYKFPNNTLKITSNKDCLENVSSGCCNCVFENLLPRPSTSFYVQGKIVDINKNPIIDSDVRFNYLPIESSKKSHFKKDTKTDEWGHYNFEFINEEVASRDNFEIVAMKKNYKSNSKTNISFNVNSKNIDDLVLFFYSLNKEPKIPFIFLEISTEGIYYTNVETAVQMVPSASLRFNVGGEKENFFVGVGWHLPYKLTTSSTFATVNGQESEIKTIHTVIGNPIFFNLKYYFNLSVNSKSYYFIDLIGRLNKLKPDPPLSNFEEDENEISEFSRFIPKINFGITVRKEFINIEPFISLSYLNLNNQSFEFNYFGRADSIESNNTSLQFALGISFSANIFGTKKNETIR